MYLENINCPEDVKALTVDELKVLSEEIRKTLLTKLSKHGGHVGPNLGMVELTVALHYVFDSPKDKIVYDVSHQSYVHKILTGRKEAFLDENHYDDVTGFSNPNESEHDFFTIGHTSTSISLASGLAKGRDLRNEKENVIAVIGDGSLSGGEAYEGLNNVVEAKTNMIVIVNDNEMSIAENYGGLYQNLKELRESDGKSSNNFFKSLGFKYYYVEDGHDYESLISILKEVKDTKIPVVVHVHTIKGKGYAPAMIDQETWHAGGPFNLGKGEFMHNDEEDYSELTAQYLLNAMQKDPNIVAITAGTPSVLGFDAKRRMQVKGQFVDVGIAEEHAIALASGIAKNGGTPIFGVYGTFISRAYDQLLQDLCLNNNPATILVNLASVYGMNDATHLGLFDIPMMSNIPNLVYLAPASKEEYFAMLKWSMKQKEHPVAIRVPAIGVISSGSEDTTDYSVLNKYEVRKQGTEVAILGLGNFYQLGSKLADILAKEHNIHATLINPKFITGLDESLLEQLKTNHKVIITLEDGILEGGFGEKIASYYGPSSILVKNYGIKKGFPDRYEVETLLKENGISIDQIIDDIKKLL